LAIAGIGVYRCRTCRARYFGRLLPDMVAPRRSRRRRGRRPVTVEAAYRPAPQPAPLLPVEPVSQPAPVLQPVPVSEPKPLLHPPLLLKPAPDSKRHQQAGATMPRGRGGRNQQPGAPIWIGVPAAAAALFIPATVWFGRPSARTEARQTASRGPNAKKGPV